MKILTSMVCMALALLIVAQKDIDGLLVDGYKGLAFAAIAMVMLAVANLISAVNDMEGGYHG